MYRATGKADLAVKVLMRGVESLPDNVELRLRLAEAHLFADDAKAAFATLEGIQIPPALAGQAASVAAFAAARSNDWQAVNARCESVDAKVRSLPLRLLQVAALVKTEQTEAAGAVIVESDAEVPFGGREARILLQAFKKSVPEPQEDEVQIAGLLAQQPAALGDYAYGSACREMGLYAAALETFRRLNDASPGQSALIGPIFYCLSRSSALADRAASARDLAAANSSMTVAWLGLAEVLKATGDTNGEREALDKALETGPDNAVVWRQRAEFFDRQGDNAAVLAAYKRLVELKPDDASVANNMAYCILRDNGDTAEALKFATQAVEKLPKNPHVLHTAGLAELRSGDVEASLKHLSLALLIRPGDPTILLDYGQALIKSGREEEGKAHIKLALQYTEQLDLNFPRRAEAEKIVGSSSEPQV